MHAIICYEEYIKVKYMNCAGFPANKIWLKNLAGQFLIKSCNLYYSLYSRSQSGLYSVKQFV